MIKQHYISLILTLTISANCSHRDDRDQGPGETPQPLQTLRPLAQVSLPQTVMLNVSSETINMWMTAISYTVEDRDPRRFVRLIALANESFLPGRSVFNDMTLVPIK